VQLLLTSSEACAYLSLPATVLTPARIRSEKSLNMGGGGAPCGACKFLRRKCVKGCVYAPYFCSEEMGAPHFGAIHKVFGASNFSKMLMHLPIQQRYDAVVSVLYEAEARLQDPVYGCVSHIYALQQQVGVSTAIELHLHFQPKPADSFRCCT
jgi:hypothetical protein